jgi:hypothetical protein
MPRIAVLALRAIQVLAALANIILSGLGMYIDNRDGP